MGFFTYFLLFLWTIVQAVAFWFPVMMIVESFKGVFNGDLLIFGIIIFIVANLLVGFITIFITGQYHKNEEKHFFFKSVVNGLCGSFRVATHILIRIILIFNASLPIDWGSYDNDNWVSTIIYSATLLDIEPSWGDFPSRESDHDSTPKYIQKARKQIAKTPHHALKPTIAGNDGRVHGPNDVLAQARSVGKYCSTYVSRDGNNVDIDFSARLSGNTIYFAINLNHNRRKAFAHDYDADAFESGVESTIKSAQKEILNLMREYSNNTTFDREYTVEFEKGRWNI